MEGHVRRLSLGSSLKYEMILSMAVLNNPDHHELQKSWIQKAKNKLPESMLEQIKDLFLYSHESMIGRILSDCDDSINNILHYLVNLAEKDENEILKRIFGENDIETATKRLNMLKNASKGSIPNEARGFFYKELGIKGEEEITGFSKKYASPRTFILQLNKTLSDFWNIFFKEEWKTNLSPELEKSIASITIDTQEVDTLGFMEEQAGKKFQGFSRVIVYISNFIAPHAVGFMEKGNNVIVIDKTCLSQGLVSVYNSLFHEMLHPLIRDLRENEALQPHFEELKGNKELEMLYNKTGMGHYGWEGLIEENIVAAFQRYLMVKLKTLDEKSAREDLYTGIQIALFNEFIENYDVTIYGSLDNFLLRVFENRNLTKATLPPEQQRDLIETLSKFWVLSGDKKE